jgi:hypothetical protein
MSPFLSRATLFTLRELLRGCWNAFRNVRRESALVAFQRGSASLWHFRLVLTAASLIYAGLFALLMLVYEWQITRLIETYSINPARPLIAFIAALIVSPAATVLGCAASYAWTTRLAGQRGNRLEHSYWIAGLWAIGGNLGLLVTLLAWVIGFGLIGILGSVAVATYTVVIGGFGFKLIYPFKDREPPFVAAGITVLIAWFALYVLQTILT